MSYTFRVTQEAHSKSSLLMNDSEPITLSCGLALIWGKFKDKDVCLFLCLQFTDPHGPLGVSQVGENRNPFPVIPAWRAWPRAGSKSH